MKKFLVFVLTLVLTLSLFSGTVLADAIVDWNDETDADYFVEVAAPDGYVNVRTGPGTNYDVMGKGVNGEVFHVIAESSGGSWAQIEYEGRYGWIALSQVERTSMPSTDADTQQNVYYGGSACDYTVIVSAPDGGVNLRYGPGTDYEIRVSMIPNGTYLNVRAEKGGWGRTVYNGAEGWIALSQVTENTSAQTQEVTPTQEPVQQEQPQPSETPMLIAPNPQQNVPDQQNVQQETVQDDSSVASDLVANLQEQQNSNTEGKAGMSFVRKLIWIIVIVFFAVLAAVILLCIWMKKTQRTDLFEDYDEYNQQQGYVPAEDYADTYADEAYETYEEEYEEQMYAQAYADDVIEEETEEEAEQTIEELTAEAAEESGEEAAEEMVEEGLEESETQTEAEQMPVSEPVEQEQSMENRISFKDDIKDMKKDL